ncbi:hypothetical protein RKD22_004403 [Streptomyces pristinaespiralis]|jgi:hypothetical protein|uniref:Uncharacterized protein n=1 Tax=Streptomyces pristinaespiralis TaxID=38300 RepID=A0A0M3QIJ9_STRPR|nr:hypothetical protein SPRI_3323 [Streptomyces pristinaespiralis]
MPPNSKSTPTEPVTGAPGRPADTRGHLAAAGPDFAVVTP